MTFDWFAPVYFCRFLFYLFIIFLSLSLSLSLKTSAPFESSLFLHLQNHTLSSFVILRRTIDPSLGSGLIQSNHSATTPLTVFFFSNRRRSILFLRRSSPSILSDPSLSRSLTPCESSSNRVSLQKTFRRFQI